MYCRGFPLGNAFERLYDLPMSELAPPAHPAVRRVQRLEAVRALSFIRTQQALDIAVESLIYEQDDYLTYTLNETMTTLQGRAPVKP